MAEPHGQSPLDALLGGSPRPIGRHWLSLLLLALAGIGALLFFVRFVAGDDSPYYTAPIERGDLVPLVSERGVVGATGQATVRAMVDGPIVWITGTHDGRVERGAVLARIDASEAHRAIALDRANGTAARAALDAAQVASQGAQERLARFAAVWKRSGGRVPALNEMEMARTEASRTALAEEAARATLRAAELALKDGQAKAANAEVRAPMAGLLVNSTVQPGQVVSTGQPLFTIAASAAPLTIEVSLSSAPAGPIDAGTPGRVRVDALPDAVQPATLSVLRVPPPPQSGPPRGVFTLVNPDPQVRPGMTATVEIDMPARKGVLLVPNAAVSFAPPGPGLGHKRARIYLLSKSGEPRRVYVTLGGSDGQRTEVFATGIQPGDQVITGWRDPDADRRARAAP